jgi:hypothetical protein
MFNLYFSNASFVHPFNSMLSVDKIHYVVSVTHQSIQANTITFGSTACPLQVHRAIGNFKISPCQFCIKLA